MAWIVIHRERNGIMTPVFSDVFTEIAVLLMVTAVGRLAEGVCDARTLPPFAELGNSH